MSATQYYLSKGYTVKNKNIIISGPDTLVVWTPLTGNRVILTDISISCNQAGTISFFKYDQNLDGINRIVAFSFAASTNISPSIGCVEGTMISGSIYARTLGNSTNGWNINLTGFELS